jgi:hypothetical protein|tara:strand:+ start:1790 stop:1975 length:186 start_codon:yes stop_codon:yes gene_type:complete
MVPAITIPIVGENLVADKGLHGFFDTGADGAEFVHRIGGNAGLREHDYHEQFARKQNSTEP